MMSAVRGLGIAMYSSVVLAATAANAEPATKNEHLTRAVALLDHLSPWKAAKALQLAWETPRNGREVVLDVLEAQGVAAAMMGRQSMARAYFEKLLQLDPERTLGKEYSPKISGPFLEARESSARKGYVSFAE